MAHIVTFYQEKKRFGKNEDTLNQLKELSDKRPQTNEHFENIKKAIEIFISTELKDRKSVV